MRFTIHIDLSDKKAKALLNYIKTLDFVRIVENNTEEDIPNHQVEEVNRRLNELEENPECAIDFDGAIAKLEAKYGL